jgi:hypothetical protein
VHCRTSSRSSDGIRSFADDLDVDELDGVDPSRRAFEGFEIERLIRVNGPSVVAAIKETGSGASEQDSHTPVLCDENRTNLWQMRFRC